MSVSSAFYPFSSNSSAGIFSFEPFDFSAWWDSIDITDILIGGGVIAGIAGLIALIVAFGPAIVAGISSIFASVFATTSVLAMIGFIIQGVLSILMSIATIYLFADTLFNMGGLFFDIQSGTGVFMDKMVQKFSAYPSFSSLIIQMDSAMTTASGSYFNPPVTFTNIMSRLGIGEAVDTIITCALN